MEFTENDWSEYKKVISLKHRNIDSQIDIPVFVKATGSIMYEEKEYKS